MDARWLSWAGDAQSLDMTTSALLRVLSLIQGSYSSKQHLLDACDLDTCAIVPEIDAKFCR